MGRATLGGGSGRIAGEKAGASSSSSARVERKGSQIAPQLMPASALRAPGRRLKCPARAGDKTGRPFSSKKILTERISALGASVKDRWQVIRSGRHRPRPSSSVLSVGSGSSHRRGVSSAPRQPRPRKAARRTFARWSLRASSPFAGTPSLRSRGAMSSSSSSSSSSASSSSAEDRASALRRRYVSLRQADLSRERLAGPVPRERATTVFPPPSPPPPPRGTPSSSTTSSSRRRASPPPPPPMRRRRRRSRGRRASSAPSSAPRPSPSPTPRRGWNTPRPSPNRPRSGGGRTRRTRSRRGRRARGTSSRSRKTRRRRRRRRMPPRK